MKLLVDEDTCGDGLVARFEAAGHEIVRLPTGASDETVFAEAQRLAIAILTSNVGRKGRRDLVGLYRLALDRTPHYGVIGIFHSTSGQWLSDDVLVQAVNRLAAQEQAQPGTALRRDGLTRLNDFL